MVFAPNDSLIACALNGSGYLRNSTIADYGDINAKIPDAHARTGGQCVVDSAFYRFRFPFPMKSRNASVYCDASPMETEVAKEATSARQSAEWGMRASQSSFTSLYERLIYEERGKRRLILLRIVYLFVYIMSSVGLNQLLTVYMPSFDNDACSLFHSCNLN